MKVIHKAVLSVILTVAVMSMASLALADHHKDAAAIEQAVLNYANSIYEMKPELLDNSVHPKLQKVGYWANEDGSGYQEMWMSFAELKELAGHFNKDGQIDAATAKREVKILGQLDKTATVRLDAEWGIDFIHLVKEGGTWMIMNVIWQTYPAEK
jgi:hypothetical protein